MLGIPPLPVTAEKEQEWYEGRAKQSENDVTFTIDERESLRPIGNTACTASTTATGAPPSTL